MGDKKSLDRWGQQGLVGPIQFWRGCVIYLKAVKLKISWEEWDYCFHFLFPEFFDFVKYV